MRTAFFLAVLAALTGGCGSAPPPYTSAPATAETVVDGDARDWPAALRPVPNEAGLSIGLRNSNDVLSVVIVASDERQARRIALGGLRLWVDPAGGTERVLGLRFPTPPAPEPAEVRRERSGARGAGVAEQVLRRRFEESLGRVEITHQGEVLVRSVPRGSLDGLETEAQWTRAGLTVEARIPLDAASGLLPLDAAESIGLGVELLDLTGFIPPNPRGRGPVATAAGAPNGRPPVPSEEVLADSGEIPTLIRWLRADLSR